MRRDNWRWVLGIAALGNLGNGLWMLADPAGWYRGLPAAVPDTGPLNEHFVRDIGAAFTVMAAGLGMSAVIPVLRLPMLGLVTLFYVLHALVHVYDTLRGLLPASHWSIDFPGVYLPALLMTALVVFLARREPFRS
jgi:hypothetical protein